MIVKKFSNYPVIFISDASTLGWNFQICAKKAMEISKKNHCLVQYVFNEIPVSIQPDMNDIAKIHANYCRRFDNRTNDYKNSPKGYKDNLLSKLADIKRKRENDETLAYIANEKFETPYELAWAQEKQINNDPCGTAIVEYAEIWAKLMQKEMRNGAKLTRELAEKNGKRADISIITGAMYGMARNCLVTNWAHGVELGAVFAYDQNKIQEARRAAQQENEMLAKKKNIVGPAQETQKIR